MKFPSFQIVRMTVVLLTSSITMMAHDKANAASRFYTPQKKAEVPEWFKIFERNDQKPQLSQPQQQSKFSSTYTGAPVFSSRATSTISIPSIQYRNSLFARPQISVSSPAPSAAGAASTVSMMPMRVKETNGATVHNIGASMGMNSGLATASSGRNSSNKSGGVAYATAMSMPAMTYELFDKNAPSTYCTDENDATNELRKAGRHKLGGFVDRPDTPPANTSPVGEPWILALFAFLFSGVIAWKRMRGKRQVNVSIKSRE